VCITRPDGPKVDKEVEQGKTMFAAAKVTLFI
jgi:hypothetical protein